MTNKKRKYNPTRAKRVRAAVAVQLPCACSICGRLVTAEMRWHADHVLSRYDAERLGVSDAEADALARPAHASCNTRAGAELKNRIAKEKPRPRVIERIERPQPTPTTEDEPFSTEQGQPRSVPSKFSPRAGEGQ